jgi:Coenzyme PQQ synthesis protein D (PqqD)
VVETADGYVVYDDQRDRVHQLNRTAALVLELCTGENTEADIARLLQNAFGLDSPPEEETQACLGQLRAEGLAA